jgi:hypothetical protein
MSSTQRDSLGSLVRRERGLAQARKLKDLPERPVDSYSQLSNLGAPGLPARHAVAYTRQSDGNPSTVANYLSFIDG